MKKILAAIFANIVYYSSVFAATIDPDSILPTDTTVVSWIDWGNVVVDSLLYVKDTIFNLMALIAISVFLYLWYKLIVARWNEEDFKKALLSFVYAIVGIVMASLAYALVSFVSWIQF